MTDPPVATDPFVHDSPATRVVFAAGAATTGLRAEIERLELTRLLVICSPEQEPLAHQLARPLTGRIAAIHPHAAMHVPANVAGAALEEALRLDVDGCLAIGGGSAIGLAKAVALRTSLPIIAVPTTYAGSEMTPVWGLTDGARKTTGRDPRVQPVTVVYDPRLSVSLPVAASITSAINAVAHAAEALYAPDRTPITSLLATESARALVDAVPRIAATPRDLRARADALYGCWLAGSVLGTTTMSLHHKLCHVLGGTFAMPHAQTHTAVLPHVLAYNLPAAPAARTALGRAFADAPGSKDPATHMFDLAAEHGAEMSLGALGLPLDGLTEVLDQLLDQAAAAPYANPRDLRRTELLSALRNAYDGSPPVLD